jgi:hypothetical protein
VVVVSKDYSDRTQPNLRDYLLESGHAADHDAFGGALNKVREGHPFSVEAPLPSWPIFPQRLK